MPSFGRSVHGVWTELCSICRWERRKAKRGDQEGKQWSDNSECLKKKEGVERNANERM